MVLLVLQRLGMVEKGPLEVPALVGKVRILQSLHMLQKLQGDLGEHPT